MAIATEMARLVLEMRDASQNEKQMKQRLELLAEHFLRITGQDTRGGQPMKDRGFTMLVTEVPSGTSEPFPRHRSERRVVVSGLRGAVRPSVPRL
jgi:hypothetical protein